MYRLLRLNLFPSEGVINQESTVPSALSKKTVCFCWVDTAPLRVDRISWVEWLNLNIQTVVYQTQTTRNKWLLMVVPMLYGN